jgi:hypothetical protein
MPVSQARRIFMSLTSPGLSTTAPSRTRRMAGPMALSALVVLVVSLPAATAQASTATATPTVTLPGEVSGISSGKVKEALSGIPLDDLSATQLGEVLAKLPGLSDLPSGLSQKDLATELTNAIEALAGEGDTLGQLSGPATLVSKLNLSTLEGLLSSNELLSLLLPGHSLSSLLTSGLGSPEPEQLLSGLLNSASKPEQLVEQVLAGIDSGKLEALLGTLPTGEPVSRTTVGELASQVGTTDAGLASSLDTTTGELPASAMALTTPLTDGKTLAVLDGAKELNLATLVPSNGGSGGSGGSSGSGGSGGSSGSGGSDGSGSSGSGGSGGTGGPGGDSGNGSNGTAGGTTVIVDNLPPQSDGASAAGAKPVVGKVKIISRKVRGNVVTMVVQIPGAGRLTVAGKDARSVSEQTSTAERVTLRVALTKAGVASARRHPRDFKVKLEASFKPIDGTSSSATSSVTFG